MQVSQKCAVHLQSVLVSAIVLKDQSDCGDRKCTEH